MSRLTSVQTVPEWFPAGVISPMTGKRIEFILRADAQIRTGAFLNNQIVASPSDEAYRLKELLCWRYPIVA